MLEILFKMLIGHAIGDFALQIDAMAKGKNRHYFPDNIPPGQKVITNWPYWMTSHALIHGGAVWVATGVAALGLAETVAHWLIDFAKCEGWINLHVDQALHVACKVIWVFVLISYYA